VHDGFANKIRTQVEEYEARTEAAEMGRIEVPTAAGGEERSLGVEQGAFVLRHCCSASFYRKSIV